MYNRSDSLRASMRSFLLSSFNKAFRRGSHTTKLPTCGRNRSYNQVAQVPSSNVTCKSPRSPSKNCRIVLAFVSMTHSMTIFPAAFLTAIEVLSVWTSIPIYLMLLIIKGVLSGRVEPNTQNPYSKRGALLYCVAKSETSTNFIAESGASRERSLTFIRSKTEKKCSPRTRNLREREFLEHQPRSQVNSLSAVVSSA